MTLHFLQAEPQSRSETSRLVKLGCLELSWVRFVAKFWGELRGGLGVKRRLEPLDPLELLDPFCRGLTLFSSRQFQSEDFSVKDYSSGGVIGFRNPG